MNFPRSLLFHFYNLFFFVLSHSTWPSQFLVSYYFSTLHSHLLPFFTVLTRPFSSLSHSLPFSRYPFGLSRSTHRLALLTKKNLSFNSLFPLRSTEISKKWKYSKKNIIKKSSWKFLVIFPKKSTEISSLPNF